MKKALICILCAITMGFFTSSCNKDSVKKEKSIINENDKEVLRNIKEVQWPKAYAENDTILLDNILDSSFQLIDGSGRTFTKKDELAWIKNNAVKHDSFRYEIKRLDIYDHGSAIVSGIGHIRNDSSYHIYASSNVFIKRDTIWKAILSHVSSYKAAIE